MNASSPTIDAGFAKLELWFQSLFDPGRGYAFPCDAQGHVNLDALSENARHNYFLARKLIGHDYATPLVVLRDGSAVA